MAHRRNLASLRPDEDGTALLEAAVVIPFLIVLTLGAMGFGMMYKDLAAAQESLRSAARYLAKLPVSRLCSTAGQDEARKLAVYGNPSANVATASPVISNWAIGNITITLDPVCPVVSSTRPVDRKITISATVPASPLAWSSITLRARQEERWIGQ